MDRRRRVSSSGPGRPWLFLLLLAAILVRAATPPGWMPNPHGALGSPFVICTADGSQLVQLDHDGHPAKPGPAQRHDLCAFAAHHAVPGPEPVAAAAPAGFAGPAPTRIAVGSASVAAARHRDQAQRAPPILV